MTADRNDGHEARPDLSRAVAELTKVAQDAAYVAIGLGVLGFQQAQVRRRELQSQLEGLQSQLGQAAIRQAKDARDQLRSYLASLAA